jgi:prepilin-type processing-associated H-X9-DG protein
MIPHLAPYGLTVPMWFCPVRPEEFALADNWSVQHLLRPISSPADLNSYFAAIYNGTFAVLYHAWWVPRPINNTFDFPVPGYASTRSRETNGWPRRLEDRIAASQPIISDYCYAPGFRTNIASARAGHSMGEKLISVNQAFADGHVETRPRSAIQWQYFGITTAFY